MSVCRKPKKIQINGFALFRRQVQSEMKQQRAFLTDSELNDLTAKRWEDFNEVQRNEWKIRAKQEKMKGRVDKVSTAFENHQRRLASNDEDDDDIDCEQYYEENADRTSGVARKSNDSSSVAAVNRSKSFNANDLPPYIFRSTANGAALPPSAKPTPPPPVFPTRNVTLEPAPGPLSPVAGLPPMSSSSRTTAGFGSSKQQQQQPAAPATLNGVGRGKMPVLVETASFLGGGGQAQTVKQTKERSAGVESYLKYIDEIESQANPDKRRQSSRQNLFSSFTWQYESDKEKLKDCSFYVLSSQKMLPNDDDDENLYIPAEICCCEFTIRDGLRQKYCTLVKPPESLHSLKTQIDHYGVEHHGYDFLQLCKEGTSCDDIAHHLLEMVKNRDNTCGNVRFFVLGSEFRDVLKALDFILRNSTLDECHKAISPSRHLAHLDDLAQSFFKFFEVDYSNAPTYGEKTVFSLNDPIDLTAILKSLNIYQDDGRICGSSQGCPFHYNPKNSDILKNAPICVLRRQHLVIEIIKSSVEFGRLNGHHIKSFAEKSVDYYAQATRPVETVVQSMKNITVNTTLLPFNVEPDEESNVRCVEAAIEIENSTLLPKLANSDDNEASSDEPNAAYNPEASELLQKYLSSGEKASSPTPSYAPYKCERNVVARLSDDDFSSSVVVAHADAATIVPDTSVVQNLLPPERRGLGRGLHLTPERSLLNVLRVRRDF